MCMEEIEELTIEIKDYDSDLAEKVKWLALNKIDLIDEKEVNHIIKDFKKNTKSEIIDE